MRQHQEQPSRFLGLGVINKSCATSVSNACSISILWETKAAGAKIPLQYYVTSWLPRAKVCGVFPSAFTRDRSPCKRAGEGAMDKHYQRLRAATEGGHGVVDVSTQGTRSYERQVKAFVYLVGREKSAGLAQLWEWVQRWIWTWGGGGAFMDSWRSTDPWLSSD